MGRHFSKWGIHFWLLHNSKGLSLTHRLRYLTKRVSPEPLYHQYFIFFSINWLIENVHQHGNPAHWMHFSWLHTHLGLKISICTIIPITVIINNYANICNCQGSNYYPELIPFRGHFVAWLTSMSISFIFGWPPGGMCVCFWWHSQLLIISEKWECKKWCL